MSDFRGRGRGGGRGSRSRGGPIRGGPRGGGRGGFDDRDGGRGGFRGRGRGDGFSRGRGGPPPRHMRDDDSPPRKVPMMSRGYDGDRGRGPISRRVDRYDDGYDRPLPPRSRDPYPPSPPRDSSRLLDRLSPPRSSLRDRDYGLSSRGASDYPSSRGDYLSPRSYSPPRDSGYRDSYTSGREDRRDTFSRSSLRDYTSPRTAVDYVGERNRDFRDSPRDYGSSRDYPPPRGSDFRDSLGGRGDFRDLPPRDLGRDRLPSRDLEDDDYPPRGGGLPQSRGGAQYEGRSSGRDFPSRGRGPNDSRSGGLDSRAGGHSRDFDHGDRDYGSSRFSSRMDDRVHSRGPPSRDYGGRGSMRGGRDDRGGRGGFMNGSRGRGGPPRGRGRPEFSRGRGGRRSPPPSRDGPLGKRPRMDDGGYSRR